MVVAWALIAGGIAILAIERGAKPGGPSRRRAIAGAPGAGRRPVPVRLDDPGHQPLGRDHHGRAGDGDRAAHGGRIQLLPGGADDDGGDDAGAVDSREALAAGLGPVGWSEIAVGFAVSFVVALVVIRAFVAYVSRRGFAPFAWYRIVAGIAALVLLTYR